MKKTVKKVISIFLVVLLLSSAVPTIGFAVESDDALSYLTWRINDGEATITDCDMSASGEIIIPSTIENCSVTNIYDSAFRDCMDITSKIGRAHV